MNIKYFSWLKNITNTNEEIINDSDIKDIKSLQIFLKKKYPKLKKYLDKKQLIRYAVNYEYVLKNKKLNSKDEIAIFPPVSGG